MQTLTHANGTTYRTFNPGEEVHVPDGRLATVVGEAVVVANSLRPWAAPAVSQLIRFSDSDPVCPGLEWPWNAGRLTPAA
jgi:hypothetical protein